MKRILLACFLLTATASVTSVPHATAQSVAPTLTSADFTTKANLLDAQIGAADKAGAGTTWKSILNMMKVALGATKQTVASAATPADKDAAMSAMTNQISIYQQIMKLKNDMTANRTALHSKLGDFAATIH